MLFESKCLPLLHWGKYVREEIFPGKVLGGVVCSVCKMFKSLFIFALLVHALS